MKMFDVIYFLQLQLVVIRGSCTMVLSLGLAKKNSLIQFHVQKNSLLIISFSFLAYLSDKNILSYTKMIWRIFCLTYLRFIVPILDIIFHIGANIFSLHASIDIWYGIFQRVAFGQECSNKITRGEDQVAGLELPDELLSIEKCKEVGYLFLT